MLNRFSQSLDYYFVADILQACECGILQPTMQIKHKGAPIIFKTSISVNFSYYSNIRAVTIQCLVGEHSIRILYTAQNL